MPAWVNAGCEEYAKRLPRQWLRLTEIPIAKRGPTVNREQTVDKEWRHMKAALPKGGLSVALDEGGRAWSTEDLASKVDAWMHEGRDIAFLIGGPDGLAPECLALAEQKWSLSALTLPHGLARVMVIEQIYRAWSLLNNHPYHRGGKI